MAVGAAGPAAARRLGALALFGAVLLAPAQPAGAQPAREAQGCRLLVADRDVEEASSSGQAIAVDADETITLVGIGPAQGEVAVDLQLGPARTTVHQGQFGGRGGAITLDVSEVAKYGMGLYHLHVHGAGCEWSFWIKVTGANPLTTPVGAGALGSFLAALLGLLRALSRAGRGVGGLKASLMSAGAAGASLNVLSQQFGISPVTTSSLALWTGAPALAGGAVQQVLQAIGRRAAAPRSLDVATSGDAGLGMPPTAPPPPPPPTAPPPPVEATAGAGVDGPVEATAGADECAPDDSTATARFLQAQVVPGGEADAAPVADVLRPGADYDVVVRVGPPDTGWLTGTVAFPDDELPEQAEPHQLTVVLTEAGAAPTPMVSTISLPAAGPSTECRFALTVPATATAFDARVVVLYGNRTLQSGAIRARVADTAADGDALRFDLDTVVRADLSDLDERQVFDATVVVDKADGRTQATGVTSAGAQLLSLEGVEELVERIEGRISSVTADPDALCSLEGEDGLALLRYLAVQGSLLRDRLLEAQVADEGILTAERLQVLALSPEAFLPLEYIYDRPPPAKDATLCPYALASMETGRCHEECLAATAVPSPVVCPLGFWCLNRVIERHAASPAHVQDLQGRADYALRVEPCGDRKALSPDRGALFAWSARVDRKQPAPSNAVIEALQEVTGGKAETAASWDEWVADVAQSSPGLLVLLAHTVEDEDLDQPALEISEDEQLVCAYLTAAHVTSSDGAPPIVLLLGCETATAGLAFETFLTAFHSKGAGIVVGTLSTVLGYHAAPVAAALVRALREAAARDATFGEALVTARRRLLGEGLLMALSLTAYGDADWRLSLQSS